MRATPDILFHLQYIGNKKAHHEKVEIREFTTPENPSFLTCASALAEIGVAQSDHAQGGASKP